jgi:hypothetical protein
MDDILGFFHEEKFRADEKPYREVKASFINNYHTLHPLYAMERYALISGADVLSRMVNVNSHFLFTDHKEINGTKEELFNISDFIRPLKEEAGEAGVNVTQEAIVAVRPAKDNVMIELPE